MVLVLHLLEKVKTRRQLVMKSKNRSLGWMNGAHFSGDPFFILLSTISLIVIMKWQTIKHLVFFMTMLDLSFSYGFRSSFISLAYLWHGLGFLWHGYLCPSLFNIYAFNSVRWHDAMMSSLEEVLSHSGCYASSELLVFFKLCTNE